MFCKNCGSELLDGENFCHKCGTKVDYKENDNINKSIGNKPNNSSKLNKKIIIVSSIVLFIMLFSSLYYFLRYKPYNDLLTKADKFMNEENYDAAINLYNDAEKYKKSTYLNQQLQLAKESKKSKETYEVGLQQMNSIEYLDAIKIFEKIDKNDTKRYSNAQEKIQECKKLYIADNLYKAIADFKNNEFNNAESILSNVFKIDAENAEALELKNDIDKALQDKDNDQSRNTTNTNQEEYKVYTNERYGFSIKYPSSFSLGNPPTNGDGIEMYSPDNSTNIIVSGINNIFNKTSLSYYNELINQISNISYKIQQDNWFVISWTEGDRIFYEKVVVGKGSINTFIIKYPSSQLKAYESVVAELNNSFKTPEVDTCH